jgi:hypothetical protein
MVVSCIDPAGPGTPIPRIFPGVNIEGIELGFSRAQVERVLGKPVVEGWGSGIDRGWRVAEYNIREVRVRLSFLVYYTSTGEEEWGPVDFVAVGNGYDGKTREGIGIGSHSSEVVQLYGSPQSIMSDSLTGDYDYQYCFNKKNMAFRFKSDTVEYINLGPRVPFSFTPKCD